MGKNIVGTKLSNADTRGELLIEKVLIATGGSLVQYDDKHKTITNSLEGKFLYDKQVRVDIYGAWCTFDFVVYMDKMIAIEYDGGFHFKPVLLKKNKLLEFMERHERDLKKDEYCESMEIPLLRIRYDQEEKIEELVKDVLSNPNNYIRNHNFEGTKYYDEWKMHFEQLLGKY